MRLKEIEAEIKITPKLAKDFRAAWFNYKRVKPIKRTRNRQIDKAKHMQAWADHTSYEWSQCCLALIDELEKAADRLPELPREKRNNNEN